MQIDLLYFEGCPFWQVGLDNLNAALEAEGIQAKIHLVNVETNSQAEHLKFLGSPTFQIDGVDLWPEERTNYVLSCRVYATPKRIQGSPTVDMLRHKLGSISRDRTWNGSS